MATSLASISGVHLLKSFIDIHSELGKDSPTAGGSSEALKFEITIHLALKSALILAWIARILGSDEYTIKRPPSKPAAFNIKP